MNSGLLPPTAAPEGTKDDWMLSIEGAVKRRPPPPPMLPLPSGFSKTTSAAVMIYTNKLVRRVGRKAVSCMRVKANQTEKNADMLPMQIN